jgi:F-type H+-transporting ATPase subunit c
MLFLFKIIKIAIFFDTNFVTGFKAIGGGCAVVSIAGSGVGIGIIFASLIEAYGNNPELNDQLFTYAIMGFALTEAIALFGLMITFLILFG